MPLHAQRPIPAVTPPPAFDPAQLQPGSVLAGSDYPNGNDLSNAHPAASNAAGRTAGVDLDAIYVERTPRYDRYAVIYQDGVPALSPENAGVQRWPAPGETVTFTAHVMNKGMQAATSFRVAWYMDGVLVKTDASTEILWPNTEAVFDLPWKWNHQQDGERLLGSHSVRFVVDPNNEVVEAFETNNVLEDQTDALALELVVAPQVYAALDNEPRLGGSYSAEDWLQRHARALNEALAESIYPATPNGVSVRVRIDKIRIAWEQPTVDLDYDGGWFVADDYRATSIYYHPEEDMDWGMLHEWAHQLGLIDTYRYSVDARTVDVLRADGSVFGAGYRFPGDGLMNTIRSKLLDEFSAAGLDRTQGYRRGYFGEYQYDLAPNIVLVVADQQGCPVTNAAVSFYQRDPASATVDENRHIDNVPEFVGTTDASGQLQLPARPSGGPITTATGFPLRNNPFGRIEVSGAGNVGLLKLQKDGREQFAWMTVAGFNLDYWRSGKPAQQQFALTWEGPAAPNGCSPATSTPMPTPSATPLPTPTATLAAPAAPDGVTTTVSERTQVTVRWNDRSKNESDFQIWRSDNRGVSWANIGSTAADAETWVDRTATCDMRYRYRVAAGNSTGSSSSDGEATATTGLCLEAAPGDFAVMVSGQSEDGASVLLIWQDNSNWEDGFRIEWAPGSSEWALLAEVGAGINEYNATGLACGTDHRFRVYAYNSAGASTFSTELVYSTPACPVTLRKLFLPVTLR